MVLKITPQYSWYAHSTEHPPRYSRNPHIYYDIPHGTEHPTVLKISSHSTHDIPHGIEHPTVLNTPTVVHTHYTGWSDTVHCRIRIQSFKICMFCFICVYNGWNIRETIIIWRTKQMEVNRLNSVQKATNLKKKSKVGINEMFSNC